MGKWPGKDGVWTKQSEREIRLPVFLPRQEWIRVRLKSQAREQVNEHSELGAKESELDHLNCIGVKKEKAGFELISWTVKYHEMHRGYPRVRV